MERKPPAFWENEKQAGEGQGTCCEDGDSRPQPWLPFTHVLSLSPAIQSVAVHVQLHFRDAF